MKTTRIVVRIAFIILLASSALVLSPQPLRSQFIVASCPYAPTICTQQVIMTNGWPNLN